ncbi:Ternary complex factor MIP1 leucine-zipper [Arabidopsis thaliana x Arabidopsis arenosa]|uniref:Ternary complex factor MIP1 leucine-zipper n=1 Tax=Arabidopsis thaliana x Arabidopsis arenosa TaxID=1240361 RepID=A0A8T1XZB1_9BRAS|nr:Ternary complex factor MIP1 leucine-zipper [Arabidopsis thaliana x Arabidopsis arenosa]
MQRQSHKRSKSYPGNKRVEDDHTSLLSLSNGFVKSEKKLSPNIVKVQSSLKQEIIELEKRLQSQFDVRNDLENALGYRETSQDDNIFTPKEILFVIILVDSRAKKKRKILNGREACGRGNRARGSNVRESLINGRRNTRKRRLICAPLINILPSEAQTFSAIIRPKHFPPLEGPNLLDR